MITLARHRRMWVLLTVSAVALATAVAPLASGPTRAEALAAMARATAYMTDTASTEGGYVWAWLPDRSRRWGEIEARPSMIWIQAPGTATMGHLFLDAHHATRDELYYRAAAKTAAALIRGQHRSGGWNYVVDLAGEASLRDWYDTVGRNAWRLEEFQRYSDNATFDDMVTAEAATLLLRLYAEKRDPLVRAALDKAIRFVLESQYPIGAWPQRFPPLPRGDGEAAHYSSYYTFNDDVAGANVEFLVQCYQALGDRRLLDPIARGMRAFVLTQQPAPQAGWALQYTPDLAPAAARTYEPRALATHTTARNVERLIRFYRLTGDATFLSRVPEALDWLDRVALPPAAATPTRSHPTFIEPGTDRPLYVHRRGSNVVNGRYYTDYSAEKTLGHYSGFRRIDTAGLRRLYAQTRALPPQEVTEGSPLAPGARPMPLPRFVAVDRVDDERPEAVIAALTREGYWLAPLGRNSHPFERHGSHTVAPGDYSSTLVGDETDTSPYTDPTITGISVRAFIRNMSVLIRFVDADAR
jgi:PelA/Pel-15E family pectate lyase